MTPSFFVGIAAALLIAASGSAFVIGFALGAQASQTQEALCKRQTARL